jgi:hypothetical protein
MPRAPIGDVQFLVHGLATVLLDVVGDPLEVVCPPRAGHDLGAFAGEQFGRGLANAGRSAGNDDDFVCNHDVPLP